MKTKILLVIGLIIIGFVSCIKEKSKDYQSVGKIIGEDIRLCPCCGGWFIQIDSLTYEFDSIPSSSNIDLRKETFPIMVKLDWQLLNQGACSDKRIIIKRIVKE